MQKIMQIFLYPNLEQIITIHDEMLKISGGLSGIKNIGHLQSVLSFVQNDIYYPNFLDKLAYLCFAINKNHTFLDGNKRTSIVVCELFLKINGYDYILPIFATIMEDIAIGVADNIITQDNLKKMLENILEGFEMTEEQKLLIFQSKQINYNP